MTDAAEPAPRRGRLIWTVPVIVFAALAGAFYWGLTAGDPSVIPSALLDQDAPQFELAPLEGLTRDGSDVPGLATNDLKTGKVTVVNVWASWCVPCRAEHPMLMQLAEDGHRMASINYKDKAEEARRFLGSLGNPFDFVGVDDTGRTAIDWGVYGVPETFVVDGNGVIRFKHVGPLTERDLREDLIPAIEAAAAAGS